MAAPSSTACTDHHLARSAFVDRLRRCRARADRARVAGGAAQASSQNSGLAGKAGASHASIDQSEEDWTYEGWPSVKAATPALALLSSRPPGQGGAATDGG